MRRLSDEMDRMFGDFIVPFGSSFGPSHRYGTSGMNRAEWFPPVEVFERDNQLVVRAELPGMNKQDVRVEVSDNTLFISGERREEHEENRGFRHTERRYGRFMRRIPLPEGTDPNQIQANFRSGLLEITLPVKRQESKSRQVEIRDDEFATRH
jgi:HSP20 family protein